MCSSQIVLGILNTTAGFLAGIFSEHASVSVHDEFLLLGGLGAAASRY